MRSESEYHPRGTSGIFKKLDRQVSYERVYADTFQFIYEKGGPSSDDERAQFRKASFIARDEEALVDPHLAKIYNYTQSARLFHRQDTRIGGFCQSASRCFHRQPTTDHQRYTYLYQSPV